MIYTLTFNPALDYVIHVDNFQENMTNRTTKEMIFYGGKGLNISFVLNAFQIPSTALGFIAGFTGNELQRGCKAQGLHCNFIQVEEGMTRINIKLKSRVETEINGMGPYIKESHMQKLFQQLSSLQADDWLILSGSIPKGMNDATYAHLLALLQDKKIHCIVDATGPLLLKTLPYHPFLIKPNIDELNALFNVKLETKDDILPYAIKLQKLGAKNVLVSCGKDGALLVDEFQQVHKLNACQGILRNSVGAGDSMIAGFLFGYLKTKNYHQALLYGSAAGSATAFQDGLMSYENFLETLQQYEESGDLHA